MGIETNRIDFKETLTVNKSEPPFKEWCVRFSL